MYNSDNWPICVYCGEYIDEPKPDVEFCSDHCERKNKENDLECLM